VPASKLEERKLYKMRMNEALQLYDKLAIKLDKEYCIKNKDRDKLSYMYLDEADNEKSIGLEDDAIDSRARWRVMKRIMNGKNHPVFTREKIFYRRLMENEETREGDLS
jgi:hypothetical protein